MSSQPLLFLGDKRKRALAARVAEILRRWRQSWVRDATDGFEVTAEAPVTGGHGELVASVVTSCWALELGAQRLAVLLLPHSMIAWAVQEPGATAADSSIGAGPGVGSITELLEQELAKTLLMELCLLDASAAVSVTRLAGDEIGEWSREARAWTLHAKTAAGSRGLSVRIAASRVEQLVPARAPQSALALESRRAAVGENTVAVRAVVGEASMSVSELSDLALDDVLVLDQRLAETVALVAPESGAMIAAGSLGRSGARRAIKLAAVPAQRN